MVSDDQNHRQIARNLKINWQIALKGRNRWLQTNNQELSIFQRLQDSERIGVTVKFIGLTHQVRNVGAIPELPLR
ncbi:MAG: hypothetical protein V7K27_05675 [Nostoc sp.]|uniref:hypothetical protein n=1 Tax=Nostoc sp. TaxID=1180 RepID=UPI002FFC472C